MSELTEFRGSKDEYFKGGDGSPLTEAQRRGFRGLDYFAENALLRLEIKPEVLQTIELVEIDLAGSDEPAAYIRWAKIRFTVGPDEAELMVFKDEESGAVFLPFVDATAGSGETYGGGRYIEVEELADGQLLVDFNYAYNPYCAYNERWVCPMTPFENRLSVRIEAGERAFRDGA